MNTKHFIERAEVAVRARVGLPGPWVHRAVLGRDLVVRSGTFAEPLIEDYDDAWMFACAQHATTVLDVGANVGQSAILMMLAGASEVVLVEANPQALSTAAENLIRNRMSMACRFVCAFAAERSNEMVEFWSIGTGAASSMYQQHAKTASRSGTATKVPTITLDELSARYGMVPDLVKVDVEGAESKVLAGASDLASKMRTRLLVEMHSPPELPMSENANLVLSWCTDVGYAAWYLDKECSLTTAAQIEQRGRCHLLLQPKAWPYPEWLRGIRQSARLPISSL